jgi:glucosyl-3-phosphoglycerate phosphatase
MQNLYVVTHPEAEHSAQDLVGGWYDSRLTARGRAEAGLIGAEMGRRCGTGRPVRLTTSDLSRCAETAQIIAGRVGAPVARDRRLREISFGEAEGRPNEWLARRQVPAPDHDRLDHRSPIAGSETRRDVAVRVTSCVEELMADEEHDHIVVTHGYAHTFVVTAWLRLPVEAVGFAAFATTPGAITHLRLDDYWRNRAVIALGDIAHLRDGAG